MKHAFISEIMTVERILLEIDKKFKFDLSFNDSLKLYNYLKEVGRVTNFFFYIQGEFSKKYQDQEKLMKYRSKLFSEALDIDLTDIERFIDNIYTTFNDSEFADLLKKNRFWCTSEKNADSSEEKH